MAYNEVILWGGTGQAKVVRPIIEYYGLRVAAVFDDTPNLLPPFSDIPLYTGWEGFKNWYSNYGNKQLGFCITIGNPHGRVRIRFHDQLIKEGLQSVIVRHPNAVIENSVTLGDGVQVMAGAVIAPEVRIGRQCIINTGAIIDHECFLEDGVEVGPGATLCGQVHVGVNAWICAGATVLPSIHIGEDAVVGAGGVVLSDVPNGATVVGVPARHIARRGEK